LYVEANDPSLENRRIKLGMQYATKLKAYPSNPAHDCVAFNLVAYCIPSLIRLFSREGSFASTYKLSTEDVLNAPSERYKFG
jgi:hypothetical protein